ncbi:Flp family type IVb pilin [Thermomicrobium sp. 4228-Ro]|uniref:Flp family type IVb pilin n=1 Tax=Thermomicrobium sp. 4228-Ro TaxID=2993937 RepID=UPI0022494C7B|nr:Flp family type IVb pilin [Thermomicrobium sp. 4228-Ro]MCX2727277.1 Flp family type IVb pilin [Thermomicrobium sp. 4228-Ro]
MLRHAVHRALPAQSLVEYGMIILFIALAVVTALTALGGSLDTFYQSVVGSFPGS